MKMKGKVLVVCFVAAFLFAFTGCDGNSKETINAINTSTRVPIAASKTETTLSAYTNRELFQAYVQNMPIVESGAYEAYYGSMEWAGYFDSANGSWSSYILSAETAPFGVKPGILSIIIADFDNDGQDEMLIISKEGMYNISKKEEDNYIMAFDTLYDSVATVTASIYEAIDGKAVETAVHELDIFPLTNVNYGNTDIFLIESGGLLQIIYEQSQLSAHTADGLSWVFKSLAYTDNQIYVKEQTSLADFGGIEASFGGNDETINAINEIIQKAGLEIAFSSIDFEQRLIESNSDRAIPVLRINNWSFYHQDDEAFAVDMKQLLDDNSFPLKPFILLINDYSDTDELLNTGLRSGIVYTPELVISKAEVDVPVLSDKERYMKSLETAYLKLDALDRLGFSVDAHNESVIEARSDVFDTWDAELNRIYDLLKDKLPEEEFNALRKSQKAWNDDWYMFTNYNDSIERVMKRTLKLIDLYFEENFHDYFTDNEITPELKALNLVKDYIAGKDDSVFEPLDPGGLIYTFSNSNYMIQYDNVLSNGHHLIHEFEVVIDDAATGVGHTATANWYEVDIISEEVFPSRG